MGDADDVQKLFFENLQKTRPFMADYLKTVESGAPVYSDYVTHTEKAIKGQKALALSAKATAVAMNVLNMALNMAITALVSAGINLLIQKLDEWIVTSDEAKQSAEDLASSWEEADQKLASTKKTIDSISSEYARLSKGVDSFGKNISLTSDEYERHNNLANQIADTIPSLVTGWTDEGTAILSTKGSVEELTAAYRALILEQNKIKAKALGETLKNFSDSNWMDPKNWYEWYNDGSTETKLSYSRKVLNSLNRDDINRANLDLAYGSYIGKTARDESGIDTVITEETLQENKRKIQSYVRALETTVEPLVETFRASVRSSLEVDEVYGEFDASVKSVISKIVKTLDADFIAGFARQENPAEAVNLWIQRSIIDPFKSFDFSGMIDARSLFDTNQLSVGEYQKQYEDFIKEISKVKLDPRVSKSIAESFEFGFSNLVANVQGKLQNAFDQNVLSLSIDDLKAASELDVPEDTLISWEALLALMAEARAAKAQTVDSLAGSIKTLTTEYDLLNAAFSEQSANGVVTYETYQKLIAANSEYASSFEAINGMLVLNADLAYDVADASAALALAEADAGRAAKQLELDAVAKDIANVNQQLQEIEGLGNRNDLYSNLLDQKDALESQSDVLERELQQYLAITGQIKSMTGAYAKFKAAQATPNQGFLYDQGSGEIKKTLKEGIKSKALNTDEVKRAIDFYVGEGDESQSGLKKRSKQAQKIADRYFTEKDPLVGLNNFQKDLLNKKKMGDLSKYFSNGKDGFKIEDGVTGSKIAEQLGMSEEAIYSMLKKIEEFDADATIDWGQLFPDGVEELSEEKTAIEQASEKITTDTDAYVKAVEDSITKIEEAKKKYEDVLNGNAPETPSTPTDPTPSAPTTPATPTVLEAPIPTQEVVITLAIQDGQLESVTSAIQEGVDGEIPITADRTELDAAIALLKLDIEGLPNGEVTITISDAGDGIGKVSTLSDALALVQQGANVSIKITLEEGTTQESLDKINESLAQLPPEIQTKITIDGSSVPGAVEGINLETGKLKDRVVTITTVHEGDGGSTPHGGIGGSATESGKTGGGGSGGGGIGRKSNTSVTGSLDSENVDEAIAKLNIFQAIWLRLKDWFGGSDYVVPDLIAPSAQAEIEEAQDGLDGIAGTTIPDKKIEIDDAQARADVQAFENRADDTVEKKINVTYSGTGGGFAKGTKNAPSGTILVDEKGAELIEHKDGTFEIGTNDGPRFTTVDKGATVHTADETKKILKRGDKPAAMYGDRFASGWNLPTPVVSTPNTSSNKKYTNSNAKVNWKKYVDQLFDWIEIRLKRLQEATDRWTREIQKSIGYISKNKAIDDTLYSINDQIAALSEAAVRYQQQADAFAKKVKMSAATVAKIQNGTMDITLYSEDNQKKIKEYQEWYEKAVDAAKAIDDLIDKQDELNRQKLDNIITQYEQFLDVVDSSSRKAQAAIDLRIATGKEILEGDYATLIDAQMNKIALLRDQQTVLEVEMQKQILEGTLVQGSDAWYEYNRSIAEIELALTEANTQMIEFEDAIKNIGVTNLGYLLTDLEQIQSSLQGTLDMAEAQGRTATDSMYKSLISNGMLQISNLEQQNALLRAQQRELDPLSEKYQEIQDLINGNEDSIRDMKNSQEQWNDALLDLRVDELMRLKDELEKTNTNYKRQLDLQQAIEDLEKAKSQRSRRILKDGQFVFEANQEEIADKQRAYDEAMHNETLNKIDDAIEAIEALKPENNVYGAVGANPVSLRDLYPSASIDELISAIVNSATTGVSLADMGGTINGAANVVNDNRTNTVTVSPNAISINVSGSDPYEVIRVLQSELSEAFIQKGYES